MIVTSVFRKPMAGRPLVALVKWQPVGPCSVQLTIEQETRCNGEGCTWTEAHLGLDADMRRERADAIDRLTRDGYSAGPIRLAR